VGAGVTIALPRLPGWISGAASRRGREGIIESTRKKGIKEEGGEKGR